MEKSSGIWYTIYLGDDIMSDKQTNKNEGIMETRATIDEKYNNYALSSTKVVERPEPKNKVVTDGGNNNHNTEGS